MKKSIIKTKSDKNNSIVNWEREFITFNDKINGCFLYVCVCMFVRITMNILRCKLHIWWTLNLYSSIPNDGIVKMIDNGFRRLEIVINIFRTFTNWIKLKKRTKIKDKNLYCFLYVNYFHDDKLLKIDQMHKWTKLRIKAVKKIYIANYLCLKVLKELFALKRLRATMD